MENYFEFICAFGHGSLNMSRALSLNSVYFTHFATDLMSFVHYLVLVL